MVLLDSALRLSDTRGANLPEILGDQVQRLVHDLHAHESEEQRKSDAGG